MSLIVPQMLWLLLVLVPALTVFFWWAWRRRQQLITQFISARLLGHLKVGVSPSRQKARMVLIVLAVVFLVLAMARPQWGVTNEEARQRGLDIIVAIDTSNSMLAEDVSPNRLVRAKLAAMDLARKARTDRLGLIAFAGAAFLQCPLTLDDAAFAQSVQALDTKTISEGGTAIEEAIEEARKAFKDEPENCKVLILFTDGEDHDGEPVAAAQKAAQDGMVIFTVGIGTTEGETLRVKDERGRLDYIRDDEGKPVKSHLDEDILQQIASATTKGFYLRLSGAKTIDTLYDRKIAPLPKTDRVAKTFQNFRERYYWPLSIAMLILLLEMFLPDRARKRSKSAPAATGALAETAVMLLLLSIPAAAFGSPSSALREYNSGKYEESFKDYGKLLDGKKDDPRLKFNAGAAAYQSQQLEEAEKLFLDTLSSPDLELQQRAYYNLGNTKYRLGQNSSDPKKKQEAWEEALKKYDSALKLNQLDSDAKFNQDFVTQQLEELKKQQQQQQQQDQKQDQQKKPDDKKQDKNQQQQENKDQQDKQQQQQQQDNKDQSKSGQGSKSDDQKQDQQQQNQPSDKSKKDDKSQSKPQKPDKPDQQQPQQAQASEASKDQAKEDAEREAAAMAAGQMTPQQAQQLLDALKGEDKVFQPTVNKRQNNSNRSRKNW